MIQLYSQMIVLFARSEGNWIIYLGMGTNNKRQNNELFLKVNLQHTVIKYTF